MSDQFKIPLTRLNVATIEAPDAKSAAARIWIASVGTFRDERLVKMAAPRSIRNASTVESEVFNQLTSTSLCTTATEGFLLDNQVEVWVIGVSQIDTES